MKAHLNVVTLGVRDLERALRFYRDLGLSSPGIIGTEFPGDNASPAGAVAMFTLDDGLIVSLYPRTELAKDAGVAPEQVAGSGVSLGCTVDSREEVDRILAVAERAGATIPGPPHERPWGIYSGYFGDPDGHLWEVVYFLPDNAPGAS
jgi:predicted lactoylglutathione lyase